MMKGSVDELYLDSCSNVLSPFSFGFRHYRSVVSLMKSRIALSLLLADSRDYRQYADRTDAPESLLCAACVSPSLLIGSSIFMAQFSFQQEFQILKDVSLGAISIFTSLLAIVATARLLPQDIEDRTVYTILAKPVPRFEYVLGKIAGVLLLLAISTLVMSAAFLVGVVSARTSSDPRDTATNDRRTT